MRQVLLLLPVIVAGCGNPCGASDVQTVTVDGGTRIAAYLHDCGATTGYSARISFYDEGNDLDSKRADVFLADHAYGICAEQIAPDTVLVKYVAGGDIFRQEHSARGVIFLYEQSACK